MNRKHGYNMCEGGRGALGYRHSPEARERMRQIAIAKGRVPWEKAKARSKEVRAAGFSGKAKKRMADAQRKRRAEQPLTEAFIQNCREAQRKFVADGKYIPRSPTPEQKAAMVAGRRKVGWHGVPQSEEKRARIAATLHAQFLINPRVTAHCITCGIAQTPENTSVCNRRSTGLNRRCRECARTYMQNWRASKTPQPETP